VEQNVLRAISEGHKQFEVGKLLNIGLDNVKKRMTSVRKKLGVTSTPAAVKAAIEQGLIAPR
jgi:DNA-binding NarL/FixJ family response regulator